MADDVKEVAIVGAGLSGLLALYHLSQSPRKFRLTAFERNFDIGGQWHYTDQTTVNELGLPVHTAIYKYLRTNTPLPLMTIPGFEYEDTSHCYPNREQVFDYLQSFCIKNDLRKYIKFNTLIQDVKQRDPSNRLTKWIVKYRDTRLKDDSRTEIFDHVIVCNGYHSSPNIPTVKGSDEFRGHITHSMYYRHPEIYAGQTVAILGGKFSATDIGLQLSQYASKIYMCNRGSEFKAPLPANMVQKLSGFKYMTDRSIVLNNGDEIVADSVIYCTGYNYNFPFLPEGIVEIVGDRIRNLYKELVPAKYETIMFMLTIKVIGSFLLGNEQARCIRALIEGSAQLPDQHEMKRTIEDDFERREVSFMTQWEYINEVAELGKLEPLQPVFKKMADTNATNYFTNLQNHRQFVFKVTGPDSFDLEQRSY